MCQVRKVVGCLDEMWSTHHEEGRTKGGREASRGEGSGLRGELRV
jgi:hypothetical protein